jgi:SSS family solute:Na+ symporter/sodium/pantothenate symporter
MAFRDSRTLRFSIIYVTIYNAIIYVPLIFIFITARTILPDLKDSDSVMPTMVVKLANPYVAGIIMAAPYGAVLSTVSGWLLIIASGLVHDLYQRFLRPKASEKEIARASYLATIFAASQQPPFLQLLVVFSSTGLAAAFLVPGLMTCFWRRASTQGAIAAMLIGPAITISLYMLGSNPSLAGSLGLPPNPEIGPPRGLRPYYLLGFDPCVWAILGSIVAGVLGSLASRPPDAARVSLLFDKQPPNAPAPATLDLHPERAAEVLRPAT